MSLAVLCGLSDEAKIITSKDIVVFCGAKQRDNLSNLLPKDCDAILSWGCCGGLVSHVGFGDVLVASDCRSDDKIIPSSQAWMKRILSANATWSIASFYSHPTETAVTTEERAALALKSGAWVADQETIAVAEVATAKGVPWAAIRSPSDIWNQTMPSFDGATNNDGSPNVKNVLWSVIKDPSDIGGLYQAAVGYRTSLRTLSAVYEVIGPSFLS